jgi:hypothetical protein
MRGPCVKRGVAPYCRFARGAGVPKQTPVASQTPLAPPPDEEQASVVGIDARLVP